MIAPSIPRARCAAPMLAALALGVAAPLNAMADEPPLPPPRPPDLTAPGNAAGEPPPATSEGAATCLAKLVAAGAGAEAVSAPATSVEGCGIDAPVRLSSITVMGGDVVSLPDHPLLACEFAAVLADYVRVIVAPVGEACCTPRSLRSKLAPAMGAGPRTVSQAPRSAPMAMD